MFLSSAVIKVSDLIFFPPELFETIRASYGDSAQKRVLLWQEVIMDNQNEDLDEQLYNVNRFFD
ncbi:hypothetical protein [Paraglaciecola psychrophila]|uniref:Uncharacterized protein n=1 Tax=Paraglaciecola psychrophila 170 TaxID=1129794 RepID=K7ADY7_9ALTE|nr:hypothetical protein [Paraglaciecola psychrophila]AGH43171.1 hypothetical protein C427_1062 [Paraglaciecola psychrophila 170]GAC38848.1 hypothetical protein GPSY_3237 [Paraglaciecola psychrophila 170]